MSALLAAGITAGAGLLGAGMSMLGKGSGGQSGQMSQTQLPGWINQAGMDNWGIAVDTANQLMGPYSGQRVASMTPEQRDLIQRLYSNVGSTNPAFAQAGAVTSGLTGYNPAMAYAQRLSDTSLAPYMDPYTQSVINPTMTLMDQSLANQQNQTAADAAKARAFGGSRQGIVEGVNNAQTNLLKGQFAGNLNMQNFAQAQAAATGDISRDLATQQFNSQQGLAGAQFRGMMARQMGDIAAGGQNAFLQGVTNALGGQQMLTAQQQAELDAARQYYMEQRQQPIDVLNIRTNALSQSPYGQTSYGQGPGPSTNPLSTGFGAAATTAGLLGTLGYLNKPTPQQVANNAPGIGQAGQFGAPWANAMSLPAYYGPTS